MAIRNHRGIQAESNGGLPVNLQDQTTPPLILPLAQQLASDSLASDAVIYSNTVILNDATGFTIGDHFRIISVDADRFYFGEILNIVTNTITLDNPIDFAYPATSECTASNINMNVNGSVTPVIFNLRTGSPSIPSDVDVTRLLFSCTTDSAVDLGKFGNLTALAKGIVFRKIDGETRNYFNVKINKDIAAIAYDWTPYDASNPGTGIYGFSARLTFGGQNKIGTVIRIGPEDNLQAIIQDDLTGLDELRITVEGHVVQD